MKFYGVRKQKNDRLSKSTAGKVIFMKELGVFESRKIRDLFVNSFVDQTTERFKWLIVFTHEQVDLIDTNEHRLCFSNLLI